MNNLHDQVGELWQMLSEFEWPRRRYWGVIIGGTVFVTWGIWSYHVDHTDPSSLPSLFTGFGFWGFAYHHQVLDRIARKFRVLRDSLAQTDIYVSAARDGTE